MLKIIFLLLLSLLQSIFALDLQCKNKPLFTVKKIITNNGELKINANETYLKNKDIYHLSGNVELLADDYYLQAENIKIIKSKKIINASGGVKLQSGDILATADNIDINQNKNKTTANSQNIKYHYLTTGAQGSLASFNNNKNIQTLNQATYSLCPITNLKWQINAHKIILDKDKNKGYAKKVKFKFFGVPLFYLANYKWVLTGRESGFLFPSFSSYKNSYESGYQIDIPYYFNLAPEKDLILTISQLSTRGGLVDGFYRHLLAKNKTDGYLQTNLQFLAKNNKNNKNRWLIDTNLNYKISKNSKLQININRVSDKLYFQEIKRNINNSNLLYSTFNFSYEKQNINAYLTTKNEQVVGNGESDYVAALELFAKKSYTSQYGNFQTSITSTNFKHKNNNKVEGLRTNIDFSLSKEFKNSSYSTTPKIKLINTNYNLKNTENKNRTTYNLSIDNKLFIRRNKKIFNRIKQTIIPRISYIYSPVKNKNSLPNFDEDYLNANYYADISYQNLFLSKRYTGIDTIEQKNNIIIGTEFNFTADAKNTYLKLQIAKSHQLDTNKSDIFTGILFNFKNFSFTQFLQYGANNNTASNSIISYKKNGTKFINLSKNIDIYNNKSSTLYGALPLTNKVHIFTGLNRSFSPDTNDYQTTGFMYNSCCFAFRLAYFKKFDNNESVSSIRFELIFKGFGSSNKKLSKQIIKDIPNYLPNL